MNGAGEKNGVRGQKKASVGSNNRRPAKKSRASAASRCGSESHRKGRRGRAVRAAGGGRERQKTGPVATEHARKKVGGITKT